VVRGVSLPSPIDFTRRPYNTGTLVTLPCDRVILGYLERALRRDSSSGSRGGGSRLCKQDVDGKIYLKNM